MSRKDAQLNLPQIPASHPLAMMQQKNAANIDQHRVQDSQETQAVSASSQQNHHQWLDAWRDPLSNLQAFSKGLATADLFADGDHRLLVATLDRKLKVFRGTSLQSESALMEMPCALCTFYMDNSMPRTPAIAVASGPYIFIYRNMRPYYKFTLPSLPIDGREEAVWQDLRAEKITPSRALEILNELKDKNTPLSSRSLDALAFDDHREAEEYMVTRRQLPLVQQTVITCMEVLKKNLDEDDSVGMLVVGTESKEVLILAPNGSTILHKVTLRGVPAFIGITGLYDVDYRIVVACRDGNLYTIKSGELMSVVIQLEAQPCGLVRIDKHIYVGCMNNVLNCYHIKGKKTFSTYFTSPITNMEILYSKARNYRVLMVALADGEIRLYNERNMISNFKFDEPIAGMKFGRYGREDHALMLIYKSGGLAVKILSRSANLNTTLGPPGPPPEQDIPLNVPKKTKLYVEQTQRERDIAIEMHRSFQRDLFKMRLSTARAFVKVLTETQGQTSSSASNNLKLTAQVQGLGPLFKIKLSLINTSSKSVQVSAFCKVDGLLISNEGQP
eukprot:TRINITY_DN2075_c0_g1_i3.p1 TRINITY_DN2075_c0_g1~~TRINITY_DN2075_c0_g1_i3.p1  ORF type:complete len:559 (+),score=112.06 TRINITY_DN2075_c0_g1_i3:50-1726(+)